MQDELIASVRNNEIARTRAALAAGADTLARDEHGWTALCWAAGSGHTALVHLLLEHGADALATASDGRTPYHIALAAGRVDSARVLADAERARGGDAVARSSGQAAFRHYCRAFPIDALRRFPEWPELRQADHGTIDGDSTSDAAILFVHADFSVTRSMWPGEEVVLDGASGPWRRFCEEDLGFRPPTDFDLLQAAVADPDDAAPETR